MGSTPAEILQKTGWARSVGGVNPYLTLFARGGVSREAAEQAVAKLQIHELPAARGCTYVVPSSDFALALKVGQGFGDEAEIQIAIKYLKATEREIEKLTHAVLSALKNEPKDPRKLKEVLGDSVRNLGAEGKKRGITTTLPLALGRLQAQGKIRRIPISGRLDQQRYSYTLWQPSPLEKSKLNSGSATIELARHFFEWIGPATLKEFQWFSGCNVKTSKEAAIELKLIAVETESEFLILPEEADPFHAFRPQTKPAYSLVSSLDNITHLRRSYAALLEPGNERKKVFADRKKGSPSLEDLPHHAILDRGQLIGLWEFEVPSGKIVWNTFAPADKELKSVIAKTEAFVRDELGDAPTFSLDSPQSRISRIALLRA